MTSASQVSITITSILISCNDEYQICHKKYGWSLYFVHIYKVSPVVMTKIHSTRPSCVVSDVSNAMFPCKLQRAHDLVSGPGVGDDGDHDGEQEEARIRQEESQDRQEDDHGVARSAQQSLL